MLKSLRHVDLPIVLLATRIVKHLATDPNTRDQLLHNAHADVVVGLVTIFERADELELPSVGYGPSPHLLVADTLCHIVVDRHAAAALVNDSESLNAIRQLLAVNDNDLRLAATRILANIASHADLGRELLSQPQLLSDLCNISRMSATETSAVAALALANLAAVDGAVSTILSSERSVDNLTKIAASENTKAALPRPAHCGALVLPAMVPWPCPLWCLGPACCGALALPAVVPWPCPLWPAMDRSCK